MSHLIWVLTGDACSDDVPPRTWYALRRVKVDGRVPPRRFPIQDTNILNSVKRDAHGYLHKGSINIYDLKNIILQTFNI